MKNVLGVIDILTIILNVLHIFIGARIFFAFGSMMEKETCVDGIRGNNAQLLDASEFTEIGQNTMITGGIMLVFGIFGMIVTEMETGVLMLVMTTVRICFFMYSILTSVRNFIEPEKVWLSSMTLGSKFTYEFEQDNRCCGWNNVFDYCDRDKILQIIYDVRTGRKDLVTKHTRQSSFFEEYADSKIYNYESFESEIFYSSEIASISKLEEINDGEDPCEPDSLNEYCVCDEMEKNDWTLNILDEPCRTDCEGNILYARESCPGHHSRDTKEKPICLLNGCGDILLAQWNFKLWLIRILFFSFIASMIVYAYFKYQLAFYYIDEINKRWVRFVSVAPEPPLLKENEACVVVDGLFDPRRVSPKDNLKEKLLFHFNSELRKLKKNEKFEYDCDSNSSDSDESSDSPETAL
ncbi:Oidioi.mRNA.OKI2018_I69.PAR.g9239.t1.cds [Oikopleura dioica]|uniref:Oidioi.mRNA.OKI2018_I69.PAR.g9239.t1.cds n=1 Tax=Oikopleura dioica TaxID=34765 RepID=A0ABN7RJM4_OIKDI|nr:Oidioi.mRNA.OKI2018_I69.PAR.g9239.t1.cds [Oikopleura dioica]